MAGGGHLCGKDVPKPHGDFAVGWRGALLGSLQVLTEASDKGFLELKRTRTGPQAGGHRPKLPRLSQSQPRHQCLMPPAELSALAFQGESSWKLNVRRDQGTAPLPERSRRGSQSVAVPATAGLLRERSDQGARRLPVGGAGRAKAKTMSSRKGFQCWPPELAGD